MSFYCKFFLANNLLTYSAYPLIFTRVSCSRAGVNEEDLYYIGTVTSRFRGGCSILKLLPRFNARESSFALNGVEDIFNVY